MNFTKQRKLIAMQNKKNLLYTIFLILVFVLFKYKSNAQISGNIVKTNAVWVENIPDWAFGYTFGNDTLVNSTNYKILNEVNIGINGGTVTSKTNYLLREEKKITYLKEPKQEEKILYNFNLTKGDSFNFSFENNNPNYKILYKIDSIKLNDNSYSKIFFFEDVEFYEMAEPEFIWIEGIGSLASLIYPIDKKASLRCFLEDNIRYYGNKAISDCFSVSVNELHSDLAIKFQNPISNKINIQFENKTPGIYIIYDSFGSCVLKENFNGQILINEINWPAGLYYIIINFENQNKSTTLKLVKQ
jgi:hypothetical protein